MYISSIFLLRRTTEFKAREDEGKRVNFRYRPYSHPNPSKVTFSNQFQISKGYIFWVIKHFFFTFEICVTRTFRKQRKISHNTKSKIGANFVTSFYRQKMLKLEKLTSWNFTEWNFPPLYPLSWFKVKGESWSWELVIFFRSQKIKCAKLRFKLARSPAKRYSLCWLTRLRRIARAIKGKLELASLLCRYGDSVIKQRDWSVHS